MMRKFRIMRKINLCLFYHFFLDASDGFCFNTAHANQERIRLYGFAF